MTVKIIREFKKGGYHCYGVKFDNNTPQIEEIMQEVIQYFKKQESYA